MRYDLLMKAMGYKDYPTLTVEEQTELEQVLRPWLEDTVDTIVEQR